MPYLSRSMQRLVELVIGLAAVATVVAGDGLPVNVAASVALGWGTAALVHLVFGSPLGLPSGEELDVVVAELGVPVSTMSPAEHQVWGVARYTGIDTSGEPVAVSLYGRDAADAQLSVQDRTILLLPGLRADFVVFPDPAGRARGLHDPAGRAGRRVHLARAGGRHRRSEPRRRPRRPAATGHSPGRARRDGVHRPTCWTPSSPPC